MVEQGTEYKRSVHDFHVRYLEQDNGICSICHGIGAKIEVRYVVRNYESAKVKKKICKNLQAHERSLWICPKCINNFKQKLILTRWEEAQDYQDLIERVMALGKERM